MSKHSTGLAASSTTLFTGSGVRFYETVRIMDKIYRNFQADNFRPLRKETETDVSYFFCGAGRVKDRLAHGEVIKLNISKALGMTSLERIIMVPDGDHAKPQVTEELQAKAGDVPAFERLCKTLVNELPRMYGTSSILMRHIVFQSDPVGTFKQNVRPRPDLVA